MMTFKFYGVRFRWQNTMTDLRTIVKLHMSDAMSFIRTGLNPEQKLQIQPIITNPSSAVHMTHEEGYSVFETNYSGIVNRAYDEILSEAFSKSAAISIGKIYDILTNIFLSNNWPVNRGLPTQVVIPINTEY